MSKSKVISVDQSIVLGCAFRYALGRSTYVVGSVVSEILRNWDNLRDGDKERFVREIYEQEKKFGLGMECDKKDWYKIVDRFHEENRV